MIRAGEAGGILDDVLERLAAFLEREADLRKKVRAALAYPAVVLSAALGLVLFLIARIVPMFAQMFDAFHVELPFTTRLLLGLGRALQQPLSWALALAGVGLGTLAVCAFARTRRGALALDRVAPAPAGRRAAAQQSDHRPHRAHAGDAAARGDRAGRRARGRAAGRRQPDLRGGAGAGRRRAARGRRADHAARTRRACSTRSRSR